MDRSNCECKYCAKKPQRVISENLGFRSGRSSTPSTPMATPSRRPPRVSRDGRDAVRRTPRETPKPYAAVRRVPKPVREAGPKQVMAHERFSDLQSMYADIDMEHRAWFRAGELVWCELSPPIRGREPTEFISFWPGIVKESKVKAEAVPRGLSVSSHSADGDYEMENGTERVHPSHLMTPHPGEAGDEEAGEAPQWDVQQCMVYKVKLLAVEHDYLVRDELVLPFQGYLPSQELISTMLSAPIEQIPTRLQDISAFNPCPEDAEDFDEVVHEQRFKDAVAPYLLAVRTASAIATYWTATDDFDFQMTAPGPAPPRPNSTPTLHEAITRATATSLEGISGVRGDMSEADLLAHRVKVLGRPAATPTYTQTRYQGLWLGAERIWCADLVRLASSRRQVAPQGAPNIYPASGPSRETIDALDQPHDAEKVAALGALDRGIFMRIESLFLAPVPDEAGTVDNQLRVSGMLYELADEGWEEPDEIKELEASAQVNGVSGSQQDALPPVEPGPAVQPPETQSAPPTNPPPLPNPDPAVPISDTVPSILAATNPPVAASASAPPPAPTVAAAPTADAPLSRPKMPQAFPLPPAPQGFKFRPILPPGNEAVISLNLVSGRYYPRILAHPLLRPVLRDLSEHVLRSGAPGGAHAPLLALEGFLPGFVCPVAADGWREGRKQMVEDAVREQTAVLVGEWDGRRRQVVEEGSRVEDVEMVDAGASANASASAGAIPSGSQVAVTS
ncbi:hypothetical protein FA95DRAFT_1565914 [Auriscalpium vulgare]|uniref:Uncharacterized protein n=1 Tax=Auriscalpium vulgare TaxID=40419 RepID=A0ACB8RAD2_9AGAM|nr:hypothetical protein FA95DRAFT_1565914 [Auriscalpium vulgare]